ncbi:MAG: hypothetical protein AB7F98_11340 [Novosphingobium sp.]
MKRLSIGLVAAALALSGCGGGDKAAAGGESGGGEAAAAGGTSVGVAECDDYMNKVMACIDSKVPEAQRAMVKQSVEQAKQQWAAIPDKGALATACKAATDQAKTTFAAWGCSF